MNISQITTVKGRSEHVLRNVSRWLESGIEELVLVDFACPEKTGKLVNDMRDPRITVVEVPIEVVGPAFHLTRARNIGGLVARHEALLFMDADAWATDSWVERVRGQMSIERGVRPEILINQTAISTEEGLDNNIDLPAQWGRDGQCMIRNHLFHEIHGYNEQFKEWGGENYDLYTRARSYGAEISTFNPLGLMILPHSDSSRTQFVSPFPEGENGRNVRFRRSLRKLKDLRRLSRATPGKLMGLGPKEVGKIRVYRGGRMVGWRPSED